MKNLDVFKYNSTKTCINRKLCFQIRYHQGRENTFVELNNHTWEGTGYIHSSSSTPDVVVPETTPLYLSVPLGCPNLGSLYCGDDSGYITCCRTATWEMVEINIL